MVDRFIANGQGKKIYLSQVRSVCALYCVVANVILVERLAVGDVRWCTTQQPQRRGERSE